MPITYSVPVFNLVFNLWRSPNAPPAAPDWSPTCQLYFNSRGIFDIVAGDITLYDPPIYLRCPMGTDIIVGDVVEVAAGDAWFYTVRWVDRAHRGFPNEYLVAVLEHQVGAPIPSVDAILMESTGHIEMEDSSLILLE